jgi:uncharacterized membrane protein YgcG
MARKFDEVLDECLERVLHGETLEDCLKSHPEHAGQLEPLLRTAMVTQKATSVEARPEFKARLRYEIASRAQASARPVPPRSPFLVWAPRWAVAIVSICLIFVLAGGSTVAAASNTVPGDTLYSVKTTSEGVWLALTFSDAAKARLQARFAERRVREMARIIESGRMGDLQGLSARFNAHLEDLSQLATAIREANPDTTQIVELEETLQQQMAGDLALLEAAEASTSPETWPAIELARNRLAQSYQEAFNALSGQQGGQQSSGTEDTSGSGGTGGTGSGGSGYGSLPGGNSGPGMN